MTQPAISILMPTYEPQPTFLKAALDSVLHQSYPHWTLLIHDDASTCDVRALIEPYLQDSRITFVRSAERLGIGGNWNACLKKSSGDLIQFLFQDDLWYRDYLEENVGIFSSNETVGIVATNHEYRMEGAAAEQFGAAADYDLLSKLRESRFAEKAQSGKDFLLWWLQRGLRPNVLGEPSFVMMRRSLVTHVGSFREDLPQVLDLEYWVRALPETTVSFNPNISGIFRIHPDSASMRNDLLGAGLGDRLLCFETVLRSFEGSPERAEIYAVIEEQLAAMVRKFSSRVRGGKKVKASGTLRAFLAFSMHHPILIFHSIAEVCRHPKYETK